MFWAAICNLFDHVFSLSERQRRYVNPIALDVSKVNYKLVFGWILHRQIAGFRS
jgi:hypothetical protein